MSNDWPVIMYPEGKRVGTVRTSENSRGRLRHVAFDSNKFRIGTFDTYNSAADCLIQIARTKGG